MTQQLPVTVAKLPPLTACDPGSMQPHELTEHRLAIGQAVEVILHGYWQPDDAETLRTAVMRDWCDTLECWKPESVLAALRKWRNENPNRRPNPGHILAILKDSWGKKHADQVRAAIAAPVEPPKERVSPEAAQRILSQLGGLPAQVLKPMDGAAE